MASPAAVTAIEIDASGAERGARLFAGAAEQVKASHRDVIDLGGRLQKSLKDTERSWERVQEKAFPLLRVQRQLQDSIDQVRNARIRGFGTDERAAEVIAGLTARYDALANRAEMAARAEQQAAIATERARQAAEDSQIAYNRLAGVHQTVAHSARASAAVFEEQARAEEAAARAAAQLAASNDNLRAKFVPLHAVQQQYLASLREIRTAGAEVFRSEAERAAALARTKEAFAEQVRAINGLNPVVQKGTAHFKQFGTIAQQSGFQLGDFAVQISSGQNAMVAFTQQFTQLVSGFGAWGAVIGAVTAVLGALYIGLSRGDEEAEKAAEGQDRLGDALKATAREAAAAGQAETILAEALDSGRVSATDLTDMSFDRVVALQRQQEAAVATAQAELAGARAALTAAQVTAQADALMSGAAGGTVGDGNADTAARAAEIERLTAALDAAAVARDRFAAEAPKAFDRDFAAPLQAEVEYQERLTVALRQGADAVREVETAEAVRREQARAGVTAESAQGQQIESLIRQRERHAAVTRTLAETEREAAADTKRRAAEGLRIADQRAETIADLKVELQQQTELRKAHEQGAIAVEAVTDAQDAYAVIRKLKLAVDSDEARLITDLVVKTNDQKRAIEGITDAQKEAAEQAKRTAADQKRAAEEAQRDYDKVIDSIANTTQEKLGDVTFDYLRGKTVDFATFLKDTLLRSVADVIAAIATQQIAIPIITSAVGVAPGLFGLSGQAAGVAQQAAGAGGFFAPITNAISTGFSTATSSISSFLFGTAAADISGGIGAITTAGTPGLFGTFGAGAGAFSAAAPWIAAAAAIAIPLLSGMFGGSPSVGETSVARVTDLRRPEDAVFSFDNGGSDTSVLTGVIEAVTDAIESGTRRFLGALRPGAGFDFGYFPSPESGNSQAAGINIKPIIDNILGTDRVKGLSEQEAVDKATLIALQEMVDYQSATLDEIARNSDATSAAEMIADLEFGQHFDALREALSALGGVVDANTLALAEQTVAIQEQARAFAEEFARPIVTGLERARELFPASRETERMVDRAVRGVDVAEYDEGSQVGSRFVAEGSAEFDRLVAGGATVIERVTSVSETVRQSAEDYAANLGRVGAAVDIARAAVGVLGQQIAGIAEPVDPVIQAWRQQIANVEALRPHLEGLNQQIREANLAFPELNRALVDVDATIAQIMANARAEQLRQFNADITELENQAAGLGGLNTIAGLVDARDANVDRARELGIALPTDGPNRYDRLLQAQVREALSGSSIGELGRMLDSGQIVDAGARAVVQTLLGERALAAARETELAGLEDLAERTRDFADAANDNARALRQAAAGNLTGGDSPLSPLARLQESERQLMAAYAAANDDDPTDAASQAAIDRLPELVERDNELSRAYYASSAANEARFWRNQEILNSTAGRQESIGRQQLTALRDIESQIVALGGTLANDNAPRYVRGGDGQYVSTGAGGLPAGLDLGYDPERNLRIRDAYELAGATYRGAGEGQIGQDRASNAALDALLRAMQFADGGAFLGGRPVEMFAAGGVPGGGVVDRPSMFGMRGGALGVMGEAGPEAIMPLERIGGRLGVRAIIPAAAANDHLGRGIYDLLSTMRSENAALRAEIALLRLVVAEAGDIGAEATRGVSRTIQRGQRDQRQRRRLGAAA